MELDEMPLGKAKNLKGQRFGKLTALYRVYPPANKKGTFWKCQCDCGNTIITRANCLQAGHTKSCGCLQKDNAKTQGTKRLIDLTGQKFDRLTVIGRAPETRGDHVMWKCRCDCGNFTIVSGNALKQGKTKSCGCLKIDTIRSRYSDLIHIGEQFGKLTVIDTAESHDNNQFWLCKCVCGTLLKVSTNNLRRGYTQSCGCTRGEKLIQRIPNGTRFGRLTVIDFLNKKQANKKQGTFYKCKCDCGEEIIVHRMSLLNGCTISCGCLKSKGENKIQSLLSQYNLNYIKQYRFENCKNIYTLPFDFYINNNYCIEYDGQQHFYPIEYFGGEESYKKQLINDNIKNEYCKTHNIPLIRIPYWHYDDITIEDLKPETSQFLVT